MIDRRHFLFLNIGHFLDHFFLLIFASAAALSLASEWQLSYGQLIPYSMAGFIAFGIFSLPSGWLADRWSREGMMFIFFIVFARFLSFFSSMFSCFFPSYSAQ